MADSQTAETLRNKRDEIARSKGRIEASERHVTYEELVERFKKQGLKDETQDSVAAKLRHGTFAATFLLSCLAALEGVRMEDV